MQQLQIKSFKAHKDLEIPLNDKSFLLYGDNGAGKSSIYDALKIVFFKDKIEEGIEVNEYAEEVTQADTEEFFAQFNNSTLNDNFELVVNDGSFNPNEYQLFMLNLEDTEFEKYLSLLNLIEKIYFDIDSGVIARYQEIETKANQLLENFKEEIVIRIDNLDNYSIKITDNERKLFDKKDIKRYFNEAKLNLVVFSLFFAIIELAQDSSKKRVLVLDDFITSLDMSNRTFLMKHILETFNDEFQIIVLTHNVYFYNLIMYLVNDVYKIKSVWQYANLYEIGSEHKLYMNDNLIELPKLRKKIYGQNPDYTVLGNQLRQKFERLLYEFSKVIMIGGVEESNKILELLDKEENVYLLRDEYRDTQNKKRVKYKNSNDLVLEIEELIDNNKAIGDIKSKILEYKEVDDLLPDMIYIVRELKLYQKVSLHSLSHGQMGQNPVSQKEIKKSLELLEYFQNKIQFLTNKKVDGA